MDPVVSTPAIHQVLVVSRILLTDCVYGCSGGQYNAAGTHPSCPDRYRGKAFVGNQQWDM